MQAGAPDVATIRFLTGSSYEGSWNSAMHMMDGFGSYSYPDGSVYRGRFVNGKFHGYGHLKMAHPYRFTIKGEFENGKLVAVEDMWFNDGLHVQGTFEDDQFISTDWDYLTPGDRRYQTERFYGQQPVGPTAYLTSNLLARTVPKGCFDTEEGLYNSTTGWLFDRPPPFSKTVYVACPHEKAWIMRNCRSERHVNIKEPLPSFCRHIIKNNLDTENSQIKDISIYAPNQEVSRQNYFPKVCHEKTAVDGDTEGRRYTRPAFQTKSATEKCLDSHLAVEDEQFKQHEDQWQRSHATGRMPAYDRARVWTSTSDPQDGDSGMSYTMSKSKSENALRVKVKPFYDAALTMIAKKHTDSLHVVQSNMRRPGSFVDISRSIFEL